MRYQIIVIPFILGILCFILYGIVQFFPTEDGTVMLLNFFIPIGFILFAIGILLIFTKMILVLKDKN